MTRPCLPPLHRLSHLPIHTLSLPPSYTHCLHPLTHTVTLSYTPTLLCYIPLYTSSNGNRHREDDDDEEEEAELMICYPEKMVQEAVQFFRTRFELHHAVYQHHTVKAVEFMITDALVLADPYISIPGGPRVLSGVPAGATTTAAAAAGKTKEASTSGSSGGSSGSGGSSNGGGVGSRTSLDRYKMSECVYDMSALSKLKDSIVDVIRINDDPRLDLARDILDRIDRRKLYRCKWVMGGGNDLSLTQ